MRDSEGSSLATSPNVSVADVRQALSLFDLAASSPVLDLLCASEAAIRIEDWPAAVLAMAKVIELDPQTAFWRYRQALVLLKSGDSERALATLRALNDAGMPTEASLLLESEIACSLAQPDAAASAAEDATRLWPKSLPARMALGRLLCHLGYYDRAIPVLRRACEEAPREAAMHQLLSASLSATGKLRDALVSILEAIAIKPTEAEYLYTAAMLFDRLGEPEQGMGYMRRAIAAAPGLPVYLVALAHMLGRSSQDEEAVEVLARAERLDPDDAGIRDLKLSFLAHIHESRFPEGARVADPMPPSVQAGPLPSMPCAPSREAIRYEPLLALTGNDFLARLATQCRVLLALVLRDFRHRTIHSRFGIVSIFIPQAIQICSLGIVLSLFNGGQPPLGDRLFFFYATGVLPFYLFIHVIDHSQNLFLDHVGVLQVPVIARLDLVLAMAITELLIGVATAVVTFGVFEMLSYGPPSDNQIEAVFAMLAVWLFALGLGLISAIMNNLFRPWLNGWHVVSRFLYVASGVFFIPQNMPGLIRDAIVWNPLLQCIEWFRTGFFRHYEPPWLDKPYVLGIAFATTIAGLVLERALRHMMRTQ